MTNPRPTLESLNAHRARRPDTAMDELNRTLEGLESKLLELEGDAPYRPSAEPEDIYDFEPAPMSRLSSSRDKGSALRSKQDDNAAGLADIAHHLHRLRSNLYQEPITEPRRDDYETISQDMSRLHNDAVKQGYSAKIDDEFNRISASVRVLTEQSDSNNSRQLHRDLEELKRTVQTLAREESLRRLTHRWDSFDEKFEAFEQRQTKRDNVVDPALDGIGRRLDQVRQAIDTLPQSQTTSIETLEARIETLASSINQMLMPQQNAAQPQFMQQLDERLDEISRAILSSSVSRRGDHADAQRLERIEMRLADLGEQIDVVAKDQLSDTLLRRMGELSQRLDQMGESNAIPAHIVERLTEQMNLLVTHVDHALQNNSPAEFGALEGRLEQIAERLDIVAERFSRPDNQVLEELDRRFDDLTRRLDDQFANSAPDIRLMHSLEGRLEDISQQLSVNAAQSQKAGSLDSVDSEIIRNLEAQVSSIAQHLASPPHPSAVLDALNPRFDQIEHALLSNRQSVLDAAHKAAESAIAQISKHGSANDTAAMRGLAEDMKALEALARRSDERNGKTFEAVHDTLIKIVERLGTLEISPLETAKPAPTQTASNSPIADTPSTLSAPGIDDQPSSEPQPRVVGQRSPAAAAVDAAMAAVEHDSSILSDTGMSRSAKKSSLFSGLTKVMRGRQSKSAVISPAVVRSEPDADLNMANMLDSVIEAPVEHIDPDITNQPHESGSAMPDLNTIMKRVRNERRERDDPMGADADKADFITAARRAAQAAAAESARLKSDGGSRKGGRSAAKNSVVTSLIDRHRKPILLAVGAIMIAMAGLQIGSAFLKVSDEQIEEAVEATVLTPSNHDEVAQGNLQQDALPSEIPAEQNPALALDTLSAEAPAAEIAATVTATNPPAPETVSEAIEAAPVMPVSTHPETTAVAGQVFAQAESNTQPSQTIIPSIPEEAGPALLREAAAKGDAKALFEIGNRYTDGRGVTADFAKAAEWYNVSASFGFAPAEYRLGNFNEKGLGMPRDTVKAQTWYQMAAQQGNASAMHNLAVLFATGANGAPDNASAARWFEKAAELGVTDSQFNLGILAAKGLGTPVNLEESYQWFSLAAQAGDTDAAGKRDEIAKVLTADQLERAKATTELWKPKPLNEAANSIDVPDAWMENQPMTTGSVDMKKAVRNIQLILKKNGYDAGSVDGMMGAKTRTAIAAFQKANGLKPTGDVDQKLVEALLESNK